MKVLKKNNIQKRKIMASGPHFMGKKWKQGQIFMFLGSKSIEDGDYMLAPWKKSYDKFGQHIKKRRHHFADKVLCSQTYGFSSSHVWMWELDHNKGWVLKDWCFQTVVLEKTFESLLDSKEIKAVNPKRNQPWIFIGRIDAEAEAPILRPPDEKSWLTGKAPDDGKDWRQEKKRMTEDEMVGWHHQLNGHEVLQSLRMLKDREAWHAIVHWIVKSWTWLRDWKTTTRYSVFKAIYGPGTI